MDLLQDSAVLGGIAVGAVVIGVSWYLMNNKSAGGVADDNIKSRTGSFDQSKYPGGKMFVFFGSQTGTSEGFARITMEEARERGFDAEVCDLEDFDPESMKEPKLAIFLMATYGEGEPTDNAHKLHNWMKPAAEADGGMTAEDGDLSGLKFTVFGLGNKQYEHYNRMGKSTNASLERLGGERVADYGEGDDDGNLEEDFNAWREKMWVQLVERFIGSSAGVPAKDAAPKKVSLHFKVQEMTAAEVAKATKAGPVYRHNQINASTKHFFEPHSALAPVLVNRELRNTTSAVARDLVQQGGKHALEVGSTRHIEVDISNTGLAYETADNLAILPENSAQAVEAFARAMGYDLQQMFTVAPTDDSDDKKFKYNFPVPCSVRQALTCYVDMRGLPRQSNVAQLLPYVTDAKQKKWLETLLAKDSVAHAHFKQYINGNGRSLFDLLTTELSSCKIPLADMLHILPAMQPRYYTISSSSSVHPSTVHITLSVTEFALPSGRVFKGLCSAYFQGITAGNKVRAFVRPSSFRLPKKNNIPIVMIGPGTGIAPMRALIQERRYRTAQGAAAGKDTLFFGCKYSDLDFIYREELLEAQKSGLILHTAFSREQKEKIYVQHLLEDAGNAKEFLSDVDAGGYVFVCGATAMGADVHDTFLKLLQTHKGLGKESAAAFVADLQKKGRYVQELWSA